jgi:hypothetical protein
MKNYTTRRTIIFLKQIRIQKYIVARPSNFVQFVVSDNFYLIGNHISEAALAIIDKNPMLIKELANEVDKLTSFRKTSGLEYFEEILQKYK